MGDKQSRIMWKRAILATIAEFEAQAQAASAAGDCAVPTWAAAVLPELRRQAGVLASLPLPEVRAEVRRLAPDDPLRAVEVQARACAHDAAKTRAARKAWSKVDDELAARLAAAEQQIRDLQTENARLRAFADEAAPWADTGRDYPAEWDN